VLVSSAFKLPAGCASLVVCQLLMGCVHVLVLIFPSGKPGHGNRKKRYKSQPRYVGISRV
jgi:hypothetical protein